MSDLRVGLVCEGPTDYIVINAAITSLLGERTFVLTQLQPEESIAFGSTGTGWVGVYNWCLQAADQGGGSVSNNPLFDTYDVLILHLDADVADETYANGNIVTTATDLPCSMPCPAPSDTTNNLRTCPASLAWRNRYTSKHSTLYTFQEHRGLGARCLVSFRSDCHIWRCGVPRCPCERSFSKARPFPTCKGRQKDQTKISREGW